MLIWFFKVASTIDISLVEAYIAETNRIEAAAMLISSIAAITWPSCLQDESQRYALSPCLLQSWLQLLNYPFLEQ